MGKRNKTAKYWLSGEKAKAFRRKLSAMAKNTSGKYVFTFKFPLAVNGLDEDARAQIRDEYECLGSINKNTLFHFFATLHLSGFRLFSSKGEASLHRQKTQLADSDFNAQLNNAFGFNSTDSAYELLIELNKGRRNKTKESIKSKLSKLDIFKKGNKTEKSNEFIDRLSELISSQELWAQTQKEERQKCIVDAGNKLGFDFTLPPINDDYTFSVLWDSSTKDFLNQTQYPDDDPSYVMNQLVSYAAYIIKRDEEQPSKDKMNEKIKGVLLSDNKKYNALDWLFNSNKGKGIDLFAKDTQEIKDRGFDIGNYSDLDTIQEVAQNLLENKRNYKGLRELFGGTLASFISNYWERLEELEKAIGHIKPWNAKKLKQLENEDEKFKGVSNEFATKGITIERLEKLISRLQTTEKERASKALKNLMGGGQNIATSKDVEQIEHFNDAYEECRGLVLELAEILRRAGDKKGDFSALEDILPAYFLPSKKKKEEDDIEDLSQTLHKKINRYRGAAIYTNQEINNALKEEYKQLQFLCNERQEHWESIKKTAPIDIIIKGHTLTEQKRLENSRFNTDETSFTELACRKILSKIARSVYSCSTDKIRLAGIKQFLENEVFDNIREGREFFNEKKGRLYKSPFSDYKHSPLTLGMPFRDNIENATNNFIKKFLVWLDSLNNQQDINLLRDLEVLERCKYSLYLGGLTKNIETKYAMPCEGCDLNLRRSLYLETAHKTPGEVSNIFNGYASKISGLCARIARKQVIAKSRLQYIDDKSLYWLPKQDKDWRPLSHALSGNNSLSEAWEILKNKPSLLTDSNCNDPSLFTDSSCTAIAAEYLAEAVQYLEEKCKEKKEYIFRACLRQIPHNWYFKVGGTGNYPMLKPIPNDKHAPFLSDNLLDGLVEVETVKKGNINIKLISQEEYKQPEHYVRLSGPSRYKGWLDKTIIDKDCKVSFGDTSLIMEEEYKQLFNKDKEYPEAKYKQTHIQVAVVFNVDTAQSDPPIKEQFKQFIAIDLGERGIGYAVFSASHDMSDSNIQPIGAGHIVVPILRRLINRVDTHRRRTQPRQRFQSNLNTQLQQMREAAIGELAGIIDALMEKYQAFPVFESTVGGFESGRNQLKLVYNSILQLYTSSNIKAHEAKRTNHWLMQKSPQSKKPPMWEHPKLKKLNNGTRTDPLNLFPGAKVSPYRTSKICSHYKEDPLKLVEKAEGNTFKTDKNGILHLDGHKIYIFDEYKSNWKADNKSQNKLPYKLKKNYSFKNKEKLKTHIESMLRHNPLIKASKDTSQSSYLSPFVETQNDLKALMDDNNQEKWQKQMMFYHNGWVFMHADTNAAINIGQKWWREKIVGKTA